MDWTDSQRSRYRPLALFLLACLGVGAAASQITQPAIPAWYAGLLHPAIAPPNWLFAPVWTTLYVLMAVAAWRVWQATRQRPDFSFTHGAQNGQTALTDFGAGLWARDSRRGFALTAFWVQLFLNFCWSGIFFGLHQIAFALAEIVLLDAAIAVTLVLFWHRDRIAGLLMAPYLAWSGFATLLTYEFWRLNG